MPQHALLIAIGSSGDVHPFVGLGLALRRRGHEVTVATSDHFRPLIERAGLGFATLGTSEEYHASIRNPDIWHPRRGFEHVMEFSMSQLARRTYDLIASRYRPGSTIVAGTLLAVGARLAQEKLGVPYASVGFAPAVMRSIDDPPQLPGMPIYGWTPRWLRRFLFAAADALVIDRVCGRYVNPLRRELGLPPVKGILRSWWFSPTLNLCLWPARFGPPAADWAPHSVLTGFPLYDEKGATPLPDDLAEFLDAGPPPIAFTPGSAMVFGHDFFQAAVHACGALQRRGVLLTRYPEQVPPNLPASVIHCPFAPFSQLLPRVAALVHHGGIGTTSQAYAAGVPQLLMPMAHDQFDNAARVTRLGIGDSLPRPRFNGPRAARRLSRLLTDPAVASACRETARLQRAEPDGCDAAAAALEGLAKEPRSS